MRVVAPGVGFPFLSPSQAFTGFHAAMLTAVDDPTPAIAHRGGFECTLQSRGRGFALLSYRRVGGNGRIARSHSKHAYQRSFLRTSHARP